MFNTKDLSDFIKTLGASDVGFAYIGDYALNKNINFSYSITIVIHLLNSIIDDITDKPTKTYFHHYRTVNSALDYIALRAASYLQDKGYNAITVAASQTVDNDGFAGLFPHKTAATLSGLGWVGKSDLFIHNKWGPRVRLATILTDAPVAEKLIIGEIKEKCGDCTLCRDACPAMAITGEHWKPGIDRSQLIDAFACSQYMKEHFKGIGRGSVCGICMKVCRYK